MISALRSLGRKSLLTLHATHLIFLGNRTAIYCNGITLSLFMVMLYFLNSPLRIRAALFDSHNWCCSPASRSYHRLWRFARAESGSFDNMKRVWFCIWTQMSLKIRRVWNGNVSRTDTCFEREALARAEANQRSLKY